MTAHPNPLVRADGFTLIEILIVMVIISIIASVAALTITTNQKTQFAELATKLDNLIELAEEEAMLRPATLALKLTSTSIEFYRYQQDPKTGAALWQLLTKPPFNPYHYSANTRFSLTLTGKKTPLDSPKPQILILPDGSVTPFVIFIGKKGAPPYYQIKGAATGEITHAAVPANN